jgi:hypothetical protein
LPEPEPEVVPEPPPAEGVPVFEELGGIVVFDVADTVGELELLPHPVSNKISDSRRIDPEALREQQPYEFRIQTFTPSLV